MQQQAADSNLPYYRPGMTVGTIHGGVGLVVSRYLFTSPSVPSASHWRLILKTHAVERLDMREDEVAGRVSYDRPPLRVLRGGRPQGRMSTVRV